MIPPGKRRRKDFTSRPAQNEINKDIDAHIDATQLQHPKQPKKHLLVNLKICNVKSANILGQLINAFRENFVMFIT